MSDLIDRDFSQYALSIQQMTNQEINLVMDIVSVLINQMREETLEEIRELELAYSSYVKLNDHRLINDFIMRTSIPHQIRKGRLRY